MATKVKISNKKGPIEYSKDHLPGMKVPKGGSCCDNCEYWSGDLCGNEYYIKWNGSGKIPTSPDKFCSDWYEMGYKNEKEEEK